MKIATVKNLQQFFQEEAEDKLADLINMYKGEIREAGTGQIRKMIKPRPAFGHKGTFGHVLMIAGHEGTIGASVLASKAALRTGCGLLTALVPEIAAVPMLLHLPEAMVLSRQDPGIIARLDLSRFNAIGFGPGVGTGESTTFLLHYLLHHYKGPLVIDADGLTVLSKNKHWYQLLGENIILTPHPGEFDRLTQAHTSEIDRLNTQVLIAKEFGMNVLLKGHHTSIVTKDGINFNNTGNSGMATAGSGDVLTGIIASLCAQGYDTSTAAIAGAYIHGFAGNIAAKKRSMHSMLAGDIIDGIGGFFKKFEKGVGSYRLSS